MLDIPILLKADEKKLPLLDSSFSAVSLSLSLFVLFSSSVGDTLEKPGTLAPKADRKEPPIMEEFFVFLTFSESSSLFSVDSWAGELLCLQEEAEKKLPT